MSVNIGDKTLTRIAGEGFERLARSVDTVADKLGDLSRAGRFLSGRLTFETRSDDIFVVTYPRSGTTWMQFALYVLARGPQLEFDHISQVAPWFERSLALGERSAADFEALPSPRVFKSHLPFRWLPRGARYLYIVRDGRDVAVSYYHLYRSHLGFRGDFEAFYRRFLAGELQYRSWFKHVAGWRAVADRADVQLLRYEQLKRDLTGALHTVNRFWSIGADAERIAQAVELASFESMKKLQDKFDHATGEILRRGLRPGRFIRHGRSGEGTKTLSEQQQQQFERAVRRRVWWPTVELDLPQFLH